MKAKFYTTILVCNVSYVLAWFIWWLGGITVRTLDLL